MREKKLYNVVSFSGGKDSTAMLLKMLEKGMQVDCILFCDTGLEFPEMYKHIEKVGLDMGIPVTTVKADATFEYLMLEGVKKRKEDSLIVQKYGADIRGYGWPGPKLRWCTKMLKDIPRERYLSRLREEYEVIEYVGLAADEGYRMERRQNRRECCRHPLMEWGMTEADCLAYCYEKGYDWGGLYRHFKRVSCWCCPLQSLDELRQLYKYFPSLWQRLREWDGRTWRGFRKDYNVRELEVRFDFEDECREKGMPLKGKAFFFNFRKRLEEMDMDNRMQMVDIGKLVPYVNNARTHSTAQISKLRASIREFGFINPVLIDGDYGIIAGHGRVVAAQEEGLAEVPCVLVDHLTEAQKKAYILADNRYAQDAGWDEEMLRIEIEGLQGMDFDVSLTGFRDDEITDLFALKDDGVDDPTGNNKEFGEEEFGDEEFEHECPRCGFHFNGSGRNSGGVSREADDDGEE